MRSGNWRALLNGCIPSLHNLWSMPSGLGFGPKRASEFAMSIFCNFWCVASVTRPRGSRDRVNWSFPCHAVASIMRPRHMRFAQGAVASFTRSRHCQFLQKLRFVLSFHFCIFPFHPLSHSCLRSSATTQHTNHGIEW